MNPSIDISYPLNRLELNTVNRVKNTTKTPGGKGLNVARVLKEFGEDVMATGLLGGFLGQTIRSGLDNQGIKNDFSWIKGETRNCIAILHEGMQTEILEEGPLVSLSEGQSFLDHLLPVIQQSSVLSLSGSLPKGLPTDFYTLNCQIKCNTVL